MIRLSRSGLPPDDDAWLTARQERYDALRAAGAEIPDSLANSYRDPRVKGVLERETHAKCAYCESHIKHVDHGDVEHLQPKSKAPHLRLTYTNLTLACSVCNQGKDDYSVAALPLLHPFNDDPAEHLLALGPLLHWYAGSVRGQVTVKELKLNRPRLLERRGERIEQVMGLVQTVLARDPGPERDALKAVLMAEAEADREYSFVVSELLKLIDGL